MSIGKTIILGNRKGGTGKTSATLNFGYSLSMMGYSVLLVDLDSQANLSKGLGISDPSKDEHTITQPMWAYIHDQEEPMPESYIKKVGNLDFISSNETLAALELEMVSAMQRESILKSVLSSLVHQYDFILLDSGPSLGLLTINALMASDSALIVSTPESDSNEGTKLLIKSIQKIRKHIGHSIDVDGILMNMVSERTILTRDAIAQANDMFGEVITIYDTMIPRLSQFGRAKMAQQSIFQYAPASKGAEAYQRFSAEYLKKGGFSLECHKKAVAG